MYLRNFLCIFFFLLLKFSYFCGVILTFLTMRGLFKEELSVGSWLVYVDEPCYVRLGLGGVSLSCGIDFSAIDWSCVFGLPIDAVLLERFGFVRCSRGDNVWLLERLGVRLTVSLRMRGGRFECKRCALGGVVVSTWNEDIRYVHELQRWWVEKVLVRHGISLDLSLGDSL